MTKRIAIVGAGISGLVCAYHLQKQGTDVTVFESSGRVGGPIASVRRDGFLAERGPHTIMESNDGVRHLIDELGLSEERVYAPAEAHRRYVVRDGRPQALPKSPPDLLKTGVFSRAAKLALLREPFVPRRDDGVDESVTMFVKRRLNEELLHYGLELLVNGVWAGDPNRLSARHAFPKMFALERDHGSLIRGAMVRRRQAANPVRMFGFRDGNETLVRTLAERVADLRLDTPVARIERATADWDVDGELFDAVVLTVGADAYDQLDLVNDGPIDVGFMREIHYPWLSILTLGFEASQVEHPLDGFGMLAPRCENLDILGALFTSTLFPNRAPAGHVTLACFVGGARRPDLALLDESERLDRTLGSLSSVLGVRGRPVFVEQTSWPRAIPQYEVGYGRLLAQMSAIEHANPGLVFAGNLRGRVAVPDLIASGTELAASLTRAA